MNKLKTILLATVMTPSMALFPTAGTMAQGLKLAQAEKKEPEHRDQGKPAAAPHGEAPHVPAAPRAEAPHAPAAPRAEAPHAAPPAPHSEAPHAAPAAPPAEPPRQAPAPHAEPPHAGPPAAPRAEPPHSAPAPHAEPHAPAPPPPAAAHPAPPAATPHPGPAASPAPAAPHPAPGSAAQPQVSPARPEAAPARPEAAPRPPVGAPAAPAAGGAPGRLGGPAPQPTPPAPQPQQQGRGLSPAGAAAVGAAAGFVGGFMASQGVQRFDQVREQRREETRDGATVILEPGRTIVRENDRTFVVHDENERFRMLGGNVQTDRRGNELTTTYRRPDGDEVVTITDPDGQLLRRFRRTRDGHEIVIIDNTFRGPPRSFDDDVVTLPPPPNDLPRERYVVDAGTVDEHVIYDTLVAPPLAPLPRRYTLNEIRYSPDLRAYTRAVDLNTINFDTGSWSIGPNEQGTLAGIAQAMNQAIGRNPREVFLIEGHTDAVGSAVDNLSLSDRRAQSVAALLTSAFKVPPENLTTQGYGAQYLKVQTQDASRENRRVTVRRITPLLDGQR